MEPRASQLGNAYFRSHPGNSEPQLNLAPSWTSSTCITHPRRSTQPVCKLLRREPRGARDDEQGEPEATPATGGRWLSPEYGGHHGHGVARRSLDRPHGCILALGSAAAVIQWPSPQKQLFSAFFAVAEGSLGEKSLEKAWFWRGQPLFLGCIFKLAFIFCPSGLKVQIGGIIIVEV